MEPAVPHERRLPGPPHGLLALAILTVVLAPLVMAQPSDSADLILRYPPQVTFTVWGQGATYNEILLEAQPGDALNAKLLVRPLGRVNTLETARAYNVTMTLVGPENETLLASSNGTAEPGATADRRVTLNGTLPFDLQPGSYRLVFRLTTGDWDPNQGNNNPDDVPLRIGPLERISVPFQFHSRYLIGPVLFAALVAAPFAHRLARGTPFVQGLGTRTRHWWDARSAAWYQTDRTHRTRVGLTLTAALLLVGFIVTVVAVGGLAEGGGGPVDGAILGAIAALLHLGAGAWQRRRLPRHAQGGTEANARGRLVGPLQTFTVTLFLALLWQQLAALTAFFRWPELTELHGFAIIGLRHGAIFALIALGYTMVYGVLKFINFAHGEVFTWGAYFIWMLAVGGVFGVQLAFPLAILVGIVLTGALGATMERVAYRPLRGASRLAPLVTAIALSVLLQALAQFFFGPQAKSFSGAGTYGGSAYQTFFRTSVTILDQRVDYLAITAFVASILLMIGLHLFIQRSRTGRAMRAVSDDLETARTIGIRVDRIITTTFVLSGALAAVGGLFYALSFGITPTRGLIVGIKAFTAAVVGGIGNIHGAFLAGFLIGIAENVGGQFIDSRFQRVIAFAILVAFLLLRPRGIIASKEEVERR